MSKFNLVLVNTVYANDVDAYIPELWANESLIVLEDNIVMGALVHRDFESLVSRFGDVVNTRRPANFIGVRKTADDNVTDQNANATNVRVPLDQHIHVSFVLKDAEISKSFKDLVMEFLNPAMIAQAKIIDQICLGQAGRFYPNVVGYLGGMTKENSKDHPVDARTKLNINKAPDMQRYFIWTPNSEGLALKNDGFTSAERVGDGGFALREAFLGRKFGFENYSSQLAAEVTSANVTYTTGAINSTYGHAEGTTALTVDGFSAAITNNSWVSIGGDLHRVVSTSGGSTPTTITIDAPGLRRAVDDNTPVIAVTAGTVDLTAGYAAGYAKPIIVDDFAKFPTPGQLVTFGTTPTSAIYTIIQVDEVNSTILLDRPLEVGVANDVNVNVSPPGYYNFAFQRNAIALVVRPLALPPTNAGAQAAVVSYNGLSMRVTIAYDAQAQGLRVTLDMLCGVAQLDSNLGTLVLG